MGAMNGEEARQIVTYDFPSGAYARALEEAYWELGQFKPAETLEEKRLQMGWAAVNSIDVDGFTGTVDDMKQTADLLHEWGEAGLESENNRAAAPAEVTYKMRKLTAFTLRGQLSRTALLMADDLYGQIDSFLQQDGTVAASSVNPHFDDAAWYAFLENGSAS